MTESIAVRGHESPAAKDLGGPAIGLSDLRLLRRQLPPWERSDERRLFPQSPEAKEPGGDQMLTPVSEASGRR